MPSDATQIGWNIPQLSEAEFARFQTLVRDQTGIHLKEHNFISPAKIRQEGFDFLGVNIQALFERANDLPLRSVRWRLCPKKVEKWQLPERITTPRQLARAVGQIVWAQTISLTHWVTPSRPRRGAIQLITTLQQPVAWDAQVIHLTNKETATLTSLWNKAKENDWNREKDISSATVFGVTDSSATRWASITLVHGAVEDVHSADWNNNLQNCGGMWRWITRILSRGFRNGTIRLAVDNTATAAVLRRLWSKNSIVEKEMKR